MKLGIFYNKHVKNSYYIFMNRYAKHLSKYVEVEHENYLNFIENIIRKYDIVLNAEHFYSYIYHEQLVVRYREKIIPIVPIDSDKVSELGVNALNIVDEVIVPSNYVKNVLLRSGVLSKVSVVPFIIDDGFLKYGKVNNYLICKYKEKGYKIIMSSIGLDPYKKGLDILAKIYSEVLRERKDVRLLLKLDNCYYVKYVKNLPVIIYCGNLSFLNLLSLYDSSDIYVLPSRVGSFEMRGLEAIIRGKPVIASNKGAWTEYLPEEFLVKSKRVEKILTGNPIDVGGGYEMDIDDAVNKILDVLENYDEYCLMAMEHKKFLTKYNPKQVVSKLLVVIHKHI